MSADHTIAVLAEKPSVARDLARVLGADRRGEGFLYGNGYTVTWAIGHLVALAQPHEIRPEWKRWVPELRDVDARYVHEPWTAPGGVPEGYPEPIVDHAHERRVALDRYQRLRAR